ncbi:MAG: hypothetical protein JXR76_11290 [Deltaproteobacteria bacterium]|nr:hypothetical protein [Deltaproteobacteria bacterium]
MHARIMRCEEQLYGEEDKYEEQDPAIWRKIGFNPVSVAGKIEGTSKGTYSAPENDGSFDWKLSLKVHRSDEFLRAWRPTCEKGQSAPCTDEDYSYCAKSGTSVLMDVDFNVSRSDLPGVKTGFEYSDTIFVHFNESHPNADSKSRNGDLAAVATIQVDLNNSHKKYKRLTIVFSPDHSIETKMTSSADNKDDN